MPQYFACPSPDGRVCPTPRQGEPPDEHVDGHRKRPKHDDALGVVDDYFPLILARHSLIPGHDQPKDCQPLHPLGVCQLQNKTATANLRRVSSQDWNYSVHEQREQAIASLTTELHSRKAHDVSDCVPRGTPLTKSCHKYQRTTPGRSQNVVISGGRSSAPLVGGQHPTRDIWGREAASPQISRCSTLRLDP